jgi:hypothetical protein
MTDKPQEICKIQEMCPNHNQGGVTTLQEIECKGEKIPILLFGGYITQVICQHLDRNYPGPGPACKKEQNNGK